MAKFPAMPLWTDAYLADCGHLDDAETGRYLMILIHLWRAPGQRFPNDDAWLARKFRRSVDDVRTQLRPLIEEFCRNTGNWISQDRLSREFAYVSDRSKKQSDRSKSRWDKEKGLSRSNADAHNEEIETQSDPANPQKNKRKVLYRGNAPTPTPTPHKKEESKDSCAFSDFWTVYPRRLGKKAAAAKFSAAVKSGVSPQHLIDSATRYAAHVTESRIDERYVKHPTTWLNQGCWDDELKPEKNRNQADDRFARKMEMAGRLHERRESEPSVDNSATGGSAVALLPTRHIGRS